MDKKVVISGRTITEKDIKTTLFIVETYGSFSRTELAYTVCECIDWVNFKDILKIDAGFYRRPRLIMRLLHCIQTLKERSSQPQKTYTNTKCF